MIKNKLIKIEGSIIYLKTLTDDFEKDILLEWRNKDRIRINMLNCDVINKEEHTNWLNNILNDMSKIYFIAYDIIMNKPIGMACIVNINLRLSNCEWAFYIGDDDYLGKGHAIEIEYLILKYVFENLNLHRVSCLVLDFNDKVISFHKKFGFIEEGKYREYLFRNERWIDAIIMSILRNEYHGKREQIIALINRFSNRKK
jgi:UDP-4-amino-4,6-dideoxy-N-acetyl-beta-L-altrosamine N-acetyltransferase